MQLLVIAFLTISLRIHHVDLAVVLSSRYS